MNKTLTYLAVAALGFSLWAAFNNQSSNTPDLAQESSSAQDAQMEQSSPQAQLQDTSRARTSSGAEVLDTSIHYQTPAKNEHLELLPVLEGTNIDGFLAATKDGALIISLETRDFFDYFLSQADLLENPWQSIEQIHALAEEHLPAQAAEEAKQLLDSYLGYQELAYQYLSQPLAPAQEQTPEYQLHALQGAKEELMRLRRQAFEPDVVEAFFGLEEAYADYALQRLALMHDTSLSTEEREAALSEAAAKLPKEIRQSEARQLEQLQTASQ